MEGDGERGYVGYLQNLLTKHGIPYSSQEQFVSHQQQHQMTNQQFLKPPFATNLESPLCGQALSRYSRQMLLKQLGYTGQLKICNARVAVVGAGGIGCPVSLYLAGAGVGLLGIFDGDVVELNNLHRQVGHYIDTLGRPKTDSLATTLHRINPQVQVNQHPFITKTTLSILDDYDVVIDGSDNPECRYLVNDYLMGKNKKLLSGACVGWQAQITCYGGGSACYRCVWGDEQTSMGGCSSLGVIGMVPGVVGMLLALQAIKLILIGTSSLEGQLLTFDGQVCGFRKARLRNKKPECQACGEKKLDIGNYCYGKYGLCEGTISEVPDVPNVMWSQMINIVKDGHFNKIVDVRPKAQFNIMHLKCAINIPYTELIAMSQTELQGIFGQSKDNGPILVMCKVGIISKRATDYLMKHGYEDSKNIEGGINMYGKLYDPDIVNL